MKRPQKNFVVEYKGGSRRLSQRPASIWGDLDLKSISRDVQVDATSKGDLFPTNESGDDPYGKHDAVASLTEAPHGQKTKAPTQEEHMAEEALTTSPDGVAESDTSPTPEPKKRRGPRAKSQPLDAAGEATATSKPKTATSPRAKKTKTDTSQTAASAKQPRKPRKSKPVATANASATSGDEFADLLQLEEENRSLRKQLAEKLRAENADLRRRLGNS